MEAYANEIHYLSMRVMNVAMIVNIFNILYDVIIFARPDLSQYLPDWIGIIQAVVSIVGSITFGLSTTVAALYGSKTVGSPAATIPSPPGVRRRQSIIATPAPIDLSERTLTRACHELYNRWEQTGQKEKALRVNRIMETVILPHSSPMYETVYAFRETIRSHMLSRMGLSGILNLMATIFLYYNVLIYMILYSGTESGSFTFIKLNVYSTRLLYLMLNIVNPIVCLTISYVVVLADNFNSLAVYAREVSNLLGAIETEPTSPADSVRSPIPAEGNALEEQLEKIKQTVKRFTERVEDPLYHQLWVED